MSERVELIEFLRTIARPDGSIDTVADDDNLVDTNVLDSLAIVQIVIYLETHYRVDVVGIDPTRLTSIAGILGVIDR